MSSSEDEDDCVVLDNGSHTIRAGFAGHDYPRIEFRTVIGMPLYQGQTIGGKPQKKYYVGDQAIENMDVLDIRKPIERGIVTDWDAIEKVWHHVFEKLRTVPSDRNVLVTETPMNPKSHREKIAQIMFEKIKPRGLFVVSPTVLSMYSAGHGSSLIIDSGYEVTDVVFIYEGHKIPQSMFRADIGGNDITHYLVELLGKRGYMFTTAKEVEEVSLMKERCAYVSNNPRTENVDNIRQEYTLSDGSTICLDYERFQCMEAMINPKLIGSDAYGIPDLILKSINACPVDLRGIIYCNVILTGSNTMADGLESRLEQELRSLLPFNKRIRVVAYPERKTSAWVGGSIWGSLSFSQQLWMTPEKYEEFGPNIVYRSKITQDW